MKSDYTVSLCPFFRSFWQGHTIDTSLDKITLPVDSALTSLLKCGSRLPWLFFNYKHSLGFVINFSFIFKISQSMLTVLGITSKIITWNILGVSYAPSAQILQFIFFYYLINISFWLFQNTVKNQTNCLYFLKVHNEFKEKSQHLGPSDPFFMEKKPPH